MRDRDSHLSIREAELEPDAAMLITFATRI